MLQTVGHRLGLVVTQRKMGKDTLKIVGQRRTWIPTLWPPWLLKPQSSGNHEGRNLESQGTSYISSCWFFYCLFLFMKHFSCVLCLRMFDLNSFQEIIVVLFPSCYFVLFQNLYVITRFKSRFSQVFDINLNRSLQTSPLLGGPN